MLPEQLAKYTFKISGFQKKIFMKYELLSKLILTVTVIDVHLIYHNCILDLAPLSSAMYIIILLNFDIISRDILFYVRWL